MRIAVKVPRYYKAIKTGQSLSNADAAYEAQRAEEVSNSLIDRANVSKDSFTQEAKAANPEQLKEQKKRQEKSDKEDLKIQRNHNKSVDDNITRKEPTGDPSMKSSPKGQIPTIVVGSGLGAAAVQQTIEYVDKALREKKKQEEKNR